MQGMSLNQPGRLLVMVRRGPLSLTAEQVRLSVSACGVCRTDLHIVDGELAQPALPIIPGHEIVGRIVELGNGVGRFKLGDRVGVPWLGWTCGECEFCRREQENLCPSARFTGYHIDGGFANEAIADARFAFPLPENYTDEEVAPLLCAGLIGWRALHAAGDARRVGLYGFGAAAHIVTQVAKSHGQEIFAFVRPDDEKAAAST